MATPKEAPLRLVTEGKPKLVVSLGRGNVGKSTILRLLVERAMEAGRVAAIADADRTNATMSSFFADVMRPEARSESVVSAWLDELVNQQAEQKESLVLDMGGGDRVFSNFAKELELAALLEGAGIVPVALHVIGTDIDDLAYLRDHEEAGAFCPPQTALILNEGLIRDGRPREIAFAAVREHAIYRKAVARGAREVWFPSLGCMSEIVNRRLSFANAAKSLGLTNRQRVAIWRREVEKELAPIADWLP